MGTDFFLAFSPERIDPGNQQYVVENTPKVVGGVTPACREVAVALYGAAIEQIVPISSTQAAEMVKLLENTFRAVNIALVNEVAIMCDKLGIDVWEVIEAAATKPYGFMKFTPGPGVGGHCIPLDPFYLSWKMKTLNYNARFIQLAGEINSDMPRYWVEKVVDALNDAGKPLKNSRVLVLGVAYKKDIDDLRESPALDIIELLRAKGADVRYHDPYVPVISHNGHDLTCEPALDAALDAADCVVIVTDHSVYDWAHVYAKARLVVDTRHVAALRVPETTNTQMILVTGCAGFIGARVCELLLAAGRDVTGIDSLNDAYDIRLKQWRLARLVNRTGFQFHQLDIAERAGLANSALERLSFDAVINLAARAGVRYSVENPWVYYEANTVGTLNLLEFCRARGIGKFVLASSSSLYGDDSPLPFREDTNTDRPLSPYAASKKAAETLCYTYHALYGLDVTVFRYFTVYGPAGRPDMMPFRLVQWISEGRPVTVYGDGTQSRDFTYVDDIARGTIAGLRPLGYEIINLGSDRPAKLMDLIRTVEEQVGRAAVLVYKPRHPADVTATWADISKARRLLGWQPETALQDGIARLVAWYRSEREWASDINTA